MCELIFSHFLTFLRMWMWLLGCTFRLHISMPLVFSHCCPTSFDGFCMLPFIPNIVLVLFETFNVFPTLCDIHEFLLVILIAWEKKRKKFNVPMHFSRATLYIFLCCPISLGIFPKCPTPPLFFQQCSTLFDVLLIP